MNSKQWILIISHVWPVPGISGQQKRVDYMIKGLRQKYNVLFLTYGSRIKKSSHQQELAKLCDEVVIMPSIYHFNLLSKIILKCAGFLYTFLTSLKFSNFIIQYFELAPYRISKHLKDRTFAAAIFEYWHGHSSTEILKNRGIPVILDMHNILWKSYQAQKVETGLRSQKNLEKYKKFEESVWQKFDYLIAINKVECEYSQQKLGMDKVWYIPMGIDLEKWPYSLKVQETNLRVGYYGGLGTKHNQQSAIKIYQNIFPVIREEFANVEYWIIGSKPPESILNIAKTDSRVQVTGYVKNVAPVLGKMDLVLCPWNGNYGFRSRIVEVMATGTPVLTTRDAIDGMDLEHGNGIYTIDTISEWPDFIIRLLKNHDQRLLDRKNARREIEKKYSYQTTYQKIPSLIGSIQTQV